MNELEHSEKEALIDDINNTLLKHSSMNAKYIIEMLDDAGLLKEPIVGYERSNGGHGITHEDKDKPIRRWLTRDEYLLKRQQITCKANVGANI